MKRQTKKRTVLVIAALAAALATAAAAQSTQPPRDGGVYQYGDSDRSAPAGNPQMPRDEAPPRDRSAYPQPGTAADTSGAPADQRTMQDTAVQGAPNAARPPR